MYPRRLNAWNHAYRRLSLLQSPSEFVRINCHPSFLISPLHEINRIATRLWKSSVNIKPYLNHILSHAQIDCGILYIGIDHALIPQFGYIK